MKTAKKAPMNIVSSDSTPTVEMLLENNETLYEHLIIKEKIIGLLEEKVRYLETGELEPTRRKHFLRVVE